MGSKEEWEELEKWEAERLKGSSQSRSYNLSEREMQESKQKVEKLVSDLKFTGITLSLSTVVLLILIAAVFSTIVYILISDYSHKDKAISNPITENVAQEYVNNA